MLVFSLLSLEAFAILEGHFNFNNINFLVSIKRDNLKELPDFNCVIENFLVHHAVKE